jgi:hypothetical protein
VTVEITYAWCVLFLLRRHLRRAVLARNATRPELLTLKIVFGKRRFNAIRLPMVISVLDHAHAPGFSGLRLFVVFLPGWLLLRRREARLCYMGHVTMENRHGLAVAGIVTHASGTAERRAAEIMLEAEGRKAGHRITAGCGQGL